jgi:hypothetical protein
MTRRRVVCLAMAAAVLLGLDVRAVRAMVNCNISANACMYGAHGKLWFVPNGWPRAARRTVSFTTEASRSSSGDHRWGCGATDGTAKGRSWGYSNKTAASYRALAECSRKTSGSCHIMSCSASVYSQADAPSAWFNNR